MVLFFGTGDVLWVAFSLASSSSPPPSSWTPKRKKSQGLMRVNRALRSTHSRREANRFISQGRLNRNGAVVTNPDHLLSSGDTVQLDGRLILWEEKDLQPHRYLKYHKPRGVVCTTDRRVKHNILDEMETSTEIIGPLVLGSVADASTSENGNDMERRVYPIGRLDADSTGLILLTSNGDIVNPLLRSGDDKSKEYHVITEPMATDDDIRQLSEGLTITTMARREGVTVPVTAKTLPCLVEMRRANKKNRDDATRDDAADIQPHSPGELRFVIREGRNRQIRKMCSTLGLEVMSLHRVAFAGITLDGCEGQGECVHLTKEEMITIGGGPTREERRSPEEKARRKLKKQNKKGK
mmetsp:Transcript_20162/g.43800  ORF Transcript_20162/g.43800 Transcript_20162/m.43800 type:complete len:353 (-) Transcript_20162:49-1107(-)